MLWCHLVARNKDIVGLYLLTVLPPLQGNGSHPVMKHGLPGVLKLFLEPVALQNVDDSNEQEKSLSFGVPRWDATGSVSR